MGNGTHMGEFLNNNSVSKTRPTKLLSTTVLTLIPVAKISIASQ
jgi:hypothetical protein